MRNSEQKIKSIAFFIASTGATIREASKYFNIPKSTIHVYMINKLINMDYNLFLKVKKILKINKEERASRGGKALKKKQLNEKGDNCKVSNMVI